MNIQELNSALTSIECFADEYVDQMKKADYGDVAKIWRWCEYDNFELDLWDKKIMISFYHSSDNAMYLSVDFDTVMNKEHSSTIAEMIAKQKEDFITAKNEQDAKKKKIEDEKKAKKDAEDYALYLKLQEKFNNK